MALQNHLLVILLACLINFCYAYQFYVGGGAGWVPNPSENYNNWAERMRFQVNDTLLFKYKKGSNSVLVVNKDDYDKCKTNNPINKMDDGNSIFKFDHSGPFFFISGNQNDCQNGSQKLITVVLAIRSPPSSPTKPPPPPTTSPAASPAKSPATSPAISPVSQTPTSSPENAPAPATSPATSPSPSTGTPSSSPAPATSTGSTPSESPAPSSTSPSSSPSGEITSPSPSPSSSGSSSSPSSSTPSSGSPGNSPPRSIAPAAGGGNSPPADVEGPTGSNNSGVKAFTTTNTAVLVSIILTMIIST